MYRITYSKEGLIKFISHLDLIRLWQRAFRRAGLPVEISKGFSPHPLISFGPPLPVGIASCCELLDVSMTPCLSSREVKKRLQSVLPHGIRVGEVYHIQGSALSLCAAIDLASYEVELEKDYEKEVLSKVAVANAAEHIVIRKKTKRGEKYRDIKSLIKELRVGKNGEGRSVLQFTISLGEAGNLNCRDLLRAVLRWTEESIQKLTVIRTALFSSRKNSGIRPRKPVLNGC